MSQTWFKENLWETASYIDVNIVFTIRSIGGNHGFPWNFRINPGIVVEMGDPSWDEGYFEQAGSQPASDR